MPDTPDLARTAPSLWEQAIEAGSERGGYLVEDDVLSAALAVLLPRIMELARKEDFIEAEFDSYVVYRYPDPASLLAALKEER
ncbi:MAG: hypothetical protein AB7G23_19320 [Vicinamibacterales bacterium]